MEKLICLAFLLIGTGCVMTPTGDLYSSPVGVEAEISGEFGPRVHTGSRSAVTVWLHPNFHVYDAYPIAQRHCGRWGFFASPVANWSVSAVSPRYLDYTCVRHRPYLAAPHFRRNPRYDYGNRYRRPYYSPRNPRRVITPKPIPRVEAPVVRRRGTFGRIFNPGSSRTETRVERGKPWEHNRRKNVSTPIRTEKRTVIQRGKPWEHNSNKVRARSSYNSFKSSRKRSTLGGLRSKIRSKKTSPRVYKSAPTSSFRSRYSNLKSKKGPSRRGTLSL